MFKCKACQAKDAHIEQLKSEVAYLRQLALPQNDPYSLPSFVLESEAIMAGYEEEIQVVPEERQATVEDNELEQVISGDYA